MEFLTVGGIKLKVVLDSRECEKYNIKSIEAGEPSPTVRASLHEILLAADDECGFNVEGERLLIQIYPLQNGGAELFVTKLSAIPERERRSVTESGIMTYTERSAYFRFPSELELLGAARARKNRVSRVYKAIDGEYYLAISENIIAGISDCEILSEFGERIHKLPLGLNGEYGSLILSDKPLSELLSNT